MTDEDFIAALNLPAAFPQLGMPKNPKGQEKDMSKHTPGPWWATDSGIRDRGGYVCHTAPPQRYEGQEERLATEIEERAANARLIAAAPDLLEALEGFADFVGRQAMKRRLEARRGASTGIAVATDDEARGWQQLDEQDMKYRTAVNAAIAKATGGAA